MVTMWVTHTTPTTIAPMDHSAVARMVLVIRTQICTPYRQMHPPDNHPGQIVKLYQLLSCKHVPNLNPPKVRMVRFLCFMRFLRLNPFWTKKPNV